MKLDVLTTVGETYRFVAVHLLSIFRIGWLPVALMLFVTKVTDDIADKSAEVALWLGVFAQILIGVIVVFGCLRIIFGRRADQGAPGYFLFEGAETRYLIAWSLIVAGFAAAVFAIGAAAEAVGDAYDIITVSFLALLAALVWIGLRLVPQPAVILAEGGLGFARAWQMTGGNLLRLGTATALCVGPVWALDAYAYHLVGGAWPVPPAWTWSLEAVAGTVSSYFAWYAQIAAEHPLPTSTIEFIRYVLEYGITAGLIGSAYTQLYVSK
jgi:hypothetical protein